MSATDDIDVAIPSVCSSIRDIPELCQNG